ncbi:MAG: hypothetical protein ACHQ50_16895 [Fimbriimonadales bacterium]
MDAYRAETTISEDGGLHLEHLPFKEGERVEVVINSAQKAIRGWPRGYFESTFGAIRDESFFRHPQGSYESREPLT